MFWTTNIFWFVIRRMFVKFTIFWTVERWTWTNIKLYILLPDCILYTQMCTQCSLNFFMSVLANALPKNVLESTKIRNNFIIFAVKIKSCLTPLLAACLHQVNLMYYGLSLKFDQEKIKGPVSWKVFIAHSQLNLHRKWV